MTWIGSPSKLLVLAGSLILTGYVLRSRPVQAAPDARNAEYVDARVCASCHRQIADDYRQTGMGRSFFRPTPANTIEDYTRQNEFYHPLSDTHYAMIRRDGEFYQRRWQIGFAGKETNVEEMKVDYVMGSGNHARSYLHRSAPGTLIELPLGWYPDGSWAMSPGSDSDQQASAYAERLLVPWPKAVVVSRFKKPAELMLSGGPEHEISGCFDP